MQVLKGLFYDIELRINDFVSKWTLRVLIVGYENYDAFVLRISQV